MGGDMGESAILTATQNDDVQQVAQILTDLDDKKLLRPEDQLNALLAREYAVEQGYEGIVEYAEDILMKQHTGGARRFMVSAVSGIAGILGGDAVYDELLRTSTEHGVAQYVPEQFQAIASSIGAAVPRIGFGLGAIYCGARLYDHASNKAVTDITLDVDATTMIPSAEELRKELYYEHGVDTYTAARYSTTRKYR